MKYLAALMVVGVVACSSSPAVSPDGGVRDGAPDGTPDGSTTVDPGLSTLTTDRDVVVVGSPPVNVYVTLRDPADNPVVGASVQLTVAAGSVTTPAASDAAGQTSAVWTNTMVGTYEVALVVDGATVATHTVEFMPASAPQPDMAHSSLVVAPASLQADGIDSSTITIHVADASGTAIAGANVALSVSGTNNVVTLASSTTDASGSDSATVSSTTAEIKTVTATISGLTLTGTVHFYGPPCTPQLPGAPGVALDYYGTTLLVDDLDGDGNADAVVQVGHSPILYRGRGDGTFDPPMMLPVVGVATVIKAADINGDGHLDLLLRTSNTSAVTFLLGLGGGQFAAPTSSGNLVPIVNQFTTGDFNGDGKLDLAVAAGHTLAIALNQGNGSFVTSQTITIDTYDLGAADLDLDGDLDLVVTTATGVKSLLGHGDGTFDAALTTAGAGAGRLVIGDFNNDGKPDCAVANPGYTLRPFLGTGTGTFTQAGSALPTAEYTGGTTGVAQIAPARDLDGDGNLDLVLGELRSLTVLRGAGDGTFSIAHVYAAENTAATTGVGLADADGDGITDVIAMRSWLLSVLHGRPDGSFIAPETHVEPDTVSIVSRTSVDFDGNGQGDLLVQTPQGIRALLSRPGGTLTDAALLAETQSAIALSAADVTGDGIPDVVGIFGESSGVTIRVANGIGDGTFAPFTSFAMPTLNAVGLAFADLDRDGKQDLVLAANQQNGVWLARSIGDGTFEAPQQLPGALNWGTTADLNGDGITDVLSTDGAMNLLLYPGDGVGGVGARSVVHTIENPPGPPIVADVTGDGRVDLLMTDGSDLTGYEVVVMPGLASGGFGNPLMTWTNEQIDSSVLADVSGDGVPDLIGLGDRTGLSVMQGYGDGYFHTHLTRYPAVDIQGLVVIGDFNRDGRIDVAFDKGLGVGIAFNGGCVP